jgi:hypothetical protein
MELLGTDFMPATFDLSVLKGAAGAAGRFGTRAAGCRRLEPAAADSGGLVFVFGSRRLGLRLRLGGARRGGLRAASGAAGAAGRLAGARLAAGARAGCHC